jgi:hypothetical protein
MAGFRSDVGASKAEAKNDEEVRRMWERYDKHVQSIGQLCITWAVLDSKVDELFEPLLQCSPAQVASLVTNVDTISARCDILRRLITLESPSPEYRKWVIALLNRVTGELAPLRNRYVHDNWSISHEAVVKIDKRAKIGKAQSRMDEELSFNTKEVTPTEVVDKLTGRVRLVFAMLHWAAYDLRHWRRTGQPLKPHPQYIEASKPNARWPTLQEAEAARRLGPKPSEYVFD